jgi:thiamine-phosphate diphosphorylase
VEGLYAIIDLPHAGGAKNPSEVLGAVLAAGCRHVQLRAKRADTRERLALSRILGPACAAVEASLWINDDLEVALAAVDGVAGVHLGQEDLAARSDDWRARLRAAGGGLGISTHDAGQLERAMVHRPDYVGFGPVFPTTGKRDPDPVVGLEGLREACDRTVIPVVAIGGIDFDRARACIGAGASAVAVIGALVAEEVAEIEARAAALHAVCIEALATRRHGARADPD